MKLISRIALEGFRSIKNSNDSLNEIGNFTAFAGLNNSGKSNILRSLNCFFNNQTDPNVPLIFRNDYYRHNLQKSTKKKRIRISIHFTLPQNFTFRKELESVKTLLKNNFVLTKEYSIQSNIPEYYLNNDQQPLKLDDKERVEQFLSLITFRYIPNRVLPTELIKNEHQALRDTLIRRLGKKGKQSSEAFEIIQTASQKLIGGFTKRMQSAIPDIGNIRLATPKTWADLIFAFGYKIGTGNAEFEDIAQGSGIQSFLMLETLYLIDKDYFQKFGWRQAAIWAIEEPESSLHSSMDVRVASYLSTISSDLKSRLQVFATTHSDFMIQYSDKAYFIEAKDKQTFCEGGLSKNDLLRKSSKSGVSRFTHPILYNPLNPIILVDGK